MATKKRGNRKSPSGRASTSARAASNPPKPTDKHGRLSVLIELRSTPGASGAHAMSAANSLTIPGLQIDQEFAPVPMSGGSGEMGAGPSYMIRGTVANEAELEELRRRSDVVAVWPDVPIAGFASSDLGMGQVQLAENPAFAPCPIGTCDCSPGTPNGTIAQVATYLGVDQIWAAGFRGAGIVVGVVDSGITAVGRPVKTGETTRRIPRVIGGWPADDWGTESSKWGDHGNMCATDVLGMAPEAQLYDLRVAGSGGSPGTISRALQSFQWAIDRHRMDGTPQVLTNSWGIFQENWDATYARNPNHPFTRKVVETINEGILVLFAAGNCGDTCPDGRCGPDVGPGRSIWGANGHPLVMTVGAVNRSERFVGYSSRGPAALDPNKPDFCSVTHFTGYFNSDSGTSAATPILAGVVAVLKQAKPSLTQAAAKTALRSTAKDIGPSGFDQHSGAGIVRAKAAFDAIRFPVATTVVADLRVTRPAVDLIATMPQGDTVSVTDIGHTNPVADRFTPPGIDLRKLPGRDTVAEQIQPPRFDPRFGGAHGGAGPGWYSPFVLATPHHAPSWRDYDVGGQAQGADEVTQLKAEIDLVSAQLQQQAEYLDQLVAAYEQLAGTGTGDGGEAPAGPS